MCYKKEVPNLVTPKMIVSSHLDVLNVLKSLGGNCLKQQTEKPKYVNCWKEHPENYRGCPVAKELQKLKK